MCRMEPDIWIIVAAVFLPFVAAALTPLLHRVLGDRVGVFGTVVAASSFVLLLTQVGTTGTFSFRWVPSLGIAARFRVDAWALLFGLVASGIGILIFAYATRYMRGEPRLGRFYVALLGFMGSVLGVAFASDLLFLFLFWELTSVFSFVLIGYHNDEESRYSARMAMVVTVGGGLCLLVGFLALSVAAGTAFEGSGFDLAAVLANADETRVALEDSGLLLPTIVLVAVGAGAKSAQVPLHFWLPNAMVAPTPVSAFLHSATMVKVGVYLVGRLRPLFLGAEWTLVFATVGLVTMTVCAVLAVLSTDIKELLAYSTASHLGLMIAGFGFVSHYGAEAGVFHLLNHALFKAALFLVAGVIAHEAGTRSLEELDKIGGLRRDLPVTAVVAVVAALSMAGVPPFGGFYSKEIFFEAAWTAAETSGGLAWLYPATAVFASIFTVLYSLRFAGIFVGERLSDATVHRPSAALVAPPAVLAAGVVAVSLVPSVFVDGILDDAAGVASVAPVEIHAGLPTELSGPVVMSAVTLTAGFVAYPFYGRISGGIGAASGTLRRLHPSRLYDGFLTNLGATSNRLAATVHNGLIRTYVAWVLAAACGLTLLGYVALSVSVVPAAFSETQIPMAFVLAVAVVAAVAVTRASSHVTGVLTLGILGFMVAIFYILASAPDLALTQLVVETLLLLIFLLVLEKIPAFYSEMKPRVAARDAALSIIVGATAFVSVLVAAPEPGSELTETARTYVDRSVPEGGGTNVVNVVLTDFRAFDTLGESVVVLVAALSVLVLVVMRARGERR